MGPAQLSRYLHLSHKWLSVPDSQTRVVSVVDSFILQFRDQQCKRTENIRRTLPSIVSDGVRYKQDSADCARYRVHLYSRHRRSSNQSFVCVDPKRIGEQNQGYLRVNLDLNRKSSHLLRAPILNCRWFLVDR